MKKSPVQTQREAFLLFLAALLVSLLTTLPAVTAASQRAIAAKPRPPVFEQLDLNRDGLVDRREAALVQGLDGVFDQADRHGDGKLDRVEYAKALSLVGGRK
jgi:hypothetical protein